MPRTPRSAYTHGIFHVTCRGVARTRICLDEVDYRALSVLLWDAAHRFEWDVFAHCLMPNHFHLILEADQPQLSAGMHRINGRHALRFNRRHDRVGHLFQNRFDSRLIKTEQHLANAIAYVVHNPVEAGLCKLPREWPWASSTYDTD